MECGSNWSRVRLGRARNLLLIEGIGVLAIIVLLLDELTSVKGSADRKCPGLTLGRDGKSLSYHSLQFLLENSMLPKATPGRPP